MDILDLWPKAGLWSSKVNDFLRPRRHILIEPEYNDYATQLKPLAESKPCYKCLQIPLQKYDDWHNLISAHLPEQGPSNCDRRGVLAKNDTLLVLAHPPLLTSSKDHFTPSRWWSSFVESCIHLSGFNTYGSVRVLATMPTTEARSAVPRSLSTRKRTAILTESVASHAFEVAAVHDPGSWIGWAGWDLMIGSAARASKKTSDNEVPIPAGREPGPILMAPESPDSLRTPCPYAPRAKTTTHDKYFASIQAGQEPGASRAEKSQRSRALSRLNLENRQAFNIQQLSEEQVTIDKLVRRLSRDAADPDLNLEALKPLVGKIEEMQAALANAVSRIPRHLAPPYPMSVDSKRAALHSGSFDNAVLEWDRRPFEPLQIARDEIYPLKADQTMLYFEADADSPVMKLLNGVDPSARAGVERIFDVISLTLGSNSTLSMPTVSEVLFPSRSPNDLVRAIPSLATFASKRPKPDFDNLPKAVHPGPAYDKRNGSSDPADCFQENLDYDLSDVRIRVLPPTTIWEIALEYQRNPGQLDAVQLSQALGGALTEYRSGALVAGRPRW